ncbi:HgcAB-associated protein HgcC [Candidatus Methylomirabilis sp.]|uniref:AbrB/MazE/SpoVT family DNA-binding domain-containing protein n=1 Tax=Candidatus Methylomirabilis tolerans TaxID=3123416 RepID=A0AAJ1AH54_9BACT|nr:AbrB/MazE/SpoVT family DNA-binding domain-containing protein [Candidatus Methylomirabilis sp.]
MARKRTATEGSGGNCCRVESLVSVDGRGQMVLPKDIRERAGIRPGDKLALATWQGEGGVCCIFLMKTEMLSGMLRSVLGPAMKALSDA